jgi:hypothetical protein
MIQRRTPEGSTDVDTRKKKEDRIRLRKEEEKERAEGEGDGGRGGKEKTVKEGEEIPNADRREGAPPLVRAMPCRDRPVEC